VARSVLTAELAAYARCGSTVPLVMVASASYPDLGIDGPAVLDRRAYQLLATTGFKGLTITDAFDTPSISGQTRPALRALGAGVDMLLYGTDEAGAAQAYARLLDDARAGRLSRTTLRAKADRLVAFKRALED
jgi:beta-glucosidase-like glycosyl hydrolase